MKQFTPLPLLFKSSILTIGIKARSLKNTQVPVSVFFSSEKLFHMANKFAFGESASLNNHLCFMVKTIIFGA